MQGCYLSCFKKELSFLKQYFNIDFYGNFQYSDIFQYMPFIVNKQ